MKKRFLSILLILCLALTLLPQMAFAEGSVSYLDADGTFKTSTGATKVTSSDTEWTGTTTSPGWYVVTGDVIIGTADAPQRVTVSGDVRLILTNGCTLTVHGGIQVQDNSDAATNTPNTNALTIYAQSTDESTMGKLIAKGAERDYNAAIGGNEGNEGNDYGGSGGAITINGGYVEATNTDGAGIGGGFGSHSGGSGGAITINGGNITASSQFGVGIGGGEAAGDGGSGGKITINGGSVIATGVNGAGIGGGQGDYYGGSGGEITITGGVVKAKSNLGAAIGGGYSGGGTGGDGGKITINGGNIAASGYYCTAIGGGYGTNGGIGGEVTITGGTVTATGNASGKATVIGAEGIGGGRYDTISGTDGTFQTTNNGNAVIFASSIGDQSNKDDWSGIIFEDNEGKVYGNPTLAAELTIPENKALDIPSGKTLTVNSTITVNGNLTNNGTIIGSGSIVPEEKKLTYKAFPSAPVIASVSADSITLQPIIGETAVEYSKDNINWQSGTTFSGLTAATSYTFYTRYQANGFYKGTPPQSGGSAPTYTAYYKEQFSLTPGGTYYFDLSGENIPGTANSGNPYGAASLPDTSLHYVPFTYAGTVNAYRLTSEMETTEEYADQKEYAHSLFVADYAVTHTVSWDDLNAKNLIFGKGYASGGVDYTLRAPSGGSYHTGSGDSERGTPTNNEWDKILDKNDGYIQNWSSMGSQGQDSSSTSSTSSDRRAARGFSSARYWYYPSPAEQIASLGFRPVLEVLNADTLGSDGLKAVTLDLNGGKLGGSSDDIQIIVKNGSTFTAPVSDGLTRPDGDTGNYFMWLGSDGKFYATGDSVPAGVTKLTAQFAVPSYTVTLNTNGGTINNGNVTGYTYGQGATLPTADDMTYTGHTFKGWYDNKALTGNPVTEISDTETGNKEYWAKWEANTYTVTLNGVNSDATGAGNYAVGVTVSIYAGTKSGYSFNGWTSDNVTITNANNKNASFTMPAKDVTVTANWTKNSGGGGGGETPHSHSYGGWKSDSANHWKECSCSDKAQIGAHSFKWVVDKAATATQKGSKHEECTVCGYKRPAVEIPAAGGTTPVRPNNPDTGALDNVPKTGDSSSLSLWIALLFVSGAGITSAAVYGRKKKENAE